ncbi:hypothetical protein WME98_19030 [Sorangium sp. So ce296]
MSEGAVVRERAASVRAEEYLGPALTVLTEETMTINGKEIHLG